MNGSNNGNGLLGGLFGGGNTNLELAKKDCEIAELKSERYADKIGIDVFKEMVGVIEKKDEKYSSMFEKLNEEAVNNRVKLAEMGCEINSIRTDMANGFANANKDLKYTYDLSSIQLNNAIAIANATFVPFAKRIDGNLITPQKMDLYNAWLTPQPQVTQPQSENPKA